MHPSIDIEKARPARSRARRWLLQAIAAAVGFNACLAAAASDWPTRPVTVLVPFPAGGGTDLIIRVLQASLGSQLGQPLVIDNKGGAGGTIGSTQLARSKPDGYTLGLVTTSTHAVAPHVYPKLAYDPLKDFAYAGTIGTTPYLLVASPSMGVDSFAALQSKLKTNSASVSFASVGVGTVSHLLGEQFQRALGTHMTHVPYRGAAPAYTDLLGGQTQIMFDNPVGLAPYVREGKLKALAATATTALLPDVKSFAQLGAPQFNQQLWYGVAFPAATPPVIVERFSTALSNTLKDPKVIKALQDYGVQVLSESPVAMKQRVAQDEKYWKEMTQGVDLNAQ